MLYKSSNIYVKAFKWPLYYIFTCLILMGVGKFLYDIFNISSAEILAFPVLITCLPYLYICRFFNVCSVTDWGVLISHEDLYKGVFLIAFLLYISNLAYLKFKIRK